MCSDHRLQTSQLLFHPALPDAERALGPYCEPACNAAAFLSAALYETNDFAGLHQLLGVAPASLPSASV